MPAFTLPPIAVTGMGMVTAQGIGVDATWAGITQGREVLAPWSNPSLPAHLRALKVAQCPPLPRPADLPPRLWNRLSRTQQLACVATDEALARAALPRRVTDRRVGVFLATTVAGMDQNERFYATFRSDPGSADADLLRRLMPPELGTLIARRHAPRRARPLVQVCLTTCVGSAMSIAAAADALRLGRCDLAIAGGSESLCRVVLSGFNALKVVAPEGCRPFDLNRPGMTVGEGAGILILERAADALARGAAPLAFLAGAAITCDAHHLTAPDPAATQAIRALRAALAAADLSPAQVAYINAHGTGTRDNDAMEAAALHAVFGPAMPPVSSTKRATGHTFGAAAAIESILCIQALRTGTLPPNAGTHTPDPALHLPLVQPPPALAPPSPPQLALCTNFAFGGNNTALLFSLPTTVQLAPDPPPPGPLALCSLGLLTNTHDSLLSFAGTLPTRAPMRALAARATPLDPAAVEQHDSLTQYALRAAHQALGAADLLGTGGTLTPPHRDDLALLFVTSWGTIDATVAYLESMLEKDGRYASPRHFSRSVYSSVPSLLAIHFGIHGPCETLTFPDDVVRRALDRSHRLLTACRARRVLLVFAEQSAPIAAQLARIAADRLHRPGVGRYAQNPLGHGAVAAVLELATGPAAIPVSAALATLHSPTVSPLDEPIAWATALLTQAPPANRPA